VEVTGRIRAALVAMDESMLQQAANLSFSG